MSNGRDTLERVAPDAARAIRVIEATAWDQAGAAGLLDWTDRRPEGLQAVTSGSAS